jgi:3',5'-cyclic AMP phosphodiesterase CpdA
LSEHIIDDLASLPVRYDSSRLHLVVSGDLTWSATDPEFDRARQCLAEIITGLDIPIERVHIVPGNHDVNWNLARDEQSRRFDNYLRFLGRFYGPVLMKQKFPAIKWPVGIDEERPLPGEILTLTLSPDDGLLIAGLNSCVYENEEHHYGYIGDRQLKLVRNQMTALEVPPEAVRIAVMHHHLHPFPEYLPVSPARELWTDVSTVRDAGIVERVLEKLGFDLVLHGHKHRAQTRETLVREPGPQKYSPQKLIVCGAGSVSCLELEHAVPNQYEVIEFTHMPRRGDAQFIRVLWRTLDVAPGAEWVTSQTWDIPG